jgi:uncharacterized protein YcbX
VTITLTALHRFPVKSCRGESMPLATVEPWGLLGDRRWMLVDDDGETVTAREHPQLLLVEPAVIDLGLLVRHPALDDLVVAVPAAPLVPVSVFGRAPFPAAVADPAAHAWFGKITGTSVRLVFAGDPTQRHTNPSFSQPGDCAACQDGYPLTLASESSLAVLNDWIAGGPLAGEGPLPMIRFRPNFVVHGADPFAEDGWRRIRIGEAEFRVVKGSDRCAIPTTDALTAARGKEPTYSLAQHRRFDGKVWFAMNLMPDTPGSVVRVGDDVEVLDAVPAPDGPPR